MRAYVIHYGEIALKGKNREVFERKLIENINRKIWEIGVKVKRRFGRLVIYADDQRIAEKLKKTPGIKYFALAEVCDLDIDEIKKKALETLPRKTKTFKIETKRSNKNFPYTSIEINRVVGEYILKRRDGIRVDLNNPDTKIFIEICEKECFIYTSKIPSIGGLPAGVAGKVISLISGGIDSPVSAFMIMKRGCEVIAVHFFNSTLHSPEVREKIKMIAEKLSEFHEIRLYMVPFEDIQREIIRLIPSKYRMVVYRRSMMRMANIIAEKEDAKAIVTGDSLSQVASQTLDNLNVIYNASSLPVLSPLIGMDKEEIIEVAKKIGTYEISILPYEDCCSLMIAKHPETRAKLNEILRIESSSGFSKNCDKLEREAVEKSEIFEFG